MNFFIHLAFCLLGIVLASLTAALAYLGTMIVRSDASLGEMLDFPTLIGIVAYMTILVAGVPALLTRVLMHVLGRREFWPYVLAAAAVASIGSLYLMFGTEWISGGRVELARTAAGFGLLGALCGLVFWLVAVRLPERLLKRQSVL